MLIFILLFSFLLSCREHRQVEENAVNVPVIDSGGLRNRSSNKTTAGLPLNPLPKDSKFTEADAIVVFNYDEEVLKRTNGLIQIYDESGNLWHEINYYNDDINSMSEPGGKFRPFSFHAGDFDLELRLTGKSANWLEVIVEEEVSPPIKKYIRADDPLFKVQSWKDYVLGIYQVMFDNEKNPILRSPDGQKQSIKLSGNMQFEPVEMKGDWLKIRLRDTENKASRKNEKIISGWIRWRSGDDFLVHDFYP